MLYHVAEAGNEAVKEFSEQAFFVPETQPLLRPLLLLTTMPLQIFGWALGSQNGYDVDQPRNLAKSVTVE